MQSFYAFAVVFTVFAFVSGASAATNISVCGQSVIGEGDLIADLDCSAHLGPAVRVNGTLRLNGFSISGNPSLVLSDFSNDPADAYEVATIFCPHNCSIVGPGEVTGASSAAPASHGVAIRGSGEIDGVTITQNGSFGLTILGKGNVKNSIVSDNGRSGVSAVRARLANVTVSGNAGVGVDTVSVKMSDSSVSGNGDDGVVASGKGAKISLSEITDNGGAGVATSGRALLRGSTISGNGEDGVVARYLAKLVDSTSAGNCTLPSAPCSDATVCERAPVLNDATCGTSLNCLAPVITTWGVCTAD